MEEEEENRQEERAKEGEEEVMEESRGWEGEFVLGGGMTTRREREQRVERLGKRGGG